MNFRSPLRPGNLHRYRKVLEAELSRYLPNYQFRLLDAPDKDDDLSSPLSFRDQILGYVSLRLKPGHERASKEVLNLFPEFILAALEKIALKKALTTDSETGLNNRDFFYFKLKKLLAPMTSGPKALKLWEGGAAPELVLALFEVGSAKRSAKADVKELSSILKTTPDLISTARLSDRRLGIIFRADASEALSLLNNIRATFLKKYPTTQYYCAYALHPQDLALDPQSPFHDPSVAAEALMEKADCALHFAFGRRTPSPAIGFGDLINSYGQIVQVLQQDRVLINLGMSMGALPGQVFTVQSPSGERKGEATIFETAEAHSLAQTNGGHVNRLAVGDNLVFSRMDWSTEPSLRSRRKDQSGLEQESFQKNLTRLAQTDRTLAVALIRLDDHERLAAMAGESELDKRLSLVAGKAKETLPPTELSTAWDQATLAMVWTNLALQQASQMATGLIKSLTIQAPISIGLVFWPNPALKPDSLISSAQKALFEAGMIGPRSLAVFGPQTLNISGDHLFDEGDLDGAMEEYQKGLLLDPGHLNLLNSLGVCHGRLGDHKSALAAFDEVLQLAPDNLMGHFNKGCSLLLVGQLEMAEQSLLKAEAIDPKSFEVLFHLGKTALELGHLELALSSLSRAAELKGRWGGVYRLLGKTKLLTADKEGALAAFKKAVKFDPDDAESLSSLGMLFLESANDQEVALSLFHRSVELDPTNSLFRQRLGRLLYELGDYPRAEHHLKAALDYGCRAEEVHQQLSSLSALAPDRDQSGAT